MLVVGGKKNQSERELKETCERVREVACMIEEGATVVLAVCQCVRECAMSEREEVLNVCMHVCCAAAAAASCAFFLSTRERE